MNIDVIQKDCEGLDGRTIVAGVRQGNARPHCFKPLSEPLPDFRSWFIEILTAMKKNPSTMPDAEVQIKCHYDQWLWHCMYLKGMSVADVLEWAEERIDYVTWQECDAVQGFQRVVPLRCKDMNSEGGGRSLDIQSLPADPPAEYRSEWQGWNDFLGVDPNTTEGSANSEQDRLDVKGLVNLSRG